MMDTLLASTKATFAKQNVSSKLPTFAGSSTHTVGISRAPPRRSVCIAKALVMLAGKTMLERTAELFEGMSDEIVIVAPPRKYEEIPWRVIADRWPGEGPLGGILTALL